MKFILGTKQKMVQYFNEEGKASPATLISAGPIVVTQLKDKEKDGYKAIQIGYLEKKKQNSKSKLGHLKNLGNFKHLREFITENDEKLKLGDTIDVSAFEKVKTVVISGVSKGKGFQGGVKRHGFHGGPRSHGQKHSEREVGSIGDAGSQRVFKGKRMPGRMGSDRITVKNLVILDIDKENNHLLVKGAVPGRLGTILEIRSLKIKL